jgi:hypothetical protein
MSTENLTHTEAIKKIKELSENARICMFCTELEQLPINFARCRFRKPMTKEISGSSVAIQATKTLR